MALCTVISTSRQWHKGYFSGTSIHNYGSTTIVRENADTCICPQRPEVDLKLQVNRTTRPESRTPWSIMLDEPATPRQHTQAAGIAR